jgi:hypothetical protein
MTRFLHLGLVRQINPYKTRSLIYHYEICQVKTYLEKGWRLKTAISVIVAIF